MNLLVTGGTGYIGSHTAIDLLSAGHNVYVIDNLSNSRVEVLQRIASIAGKSPEFIHGDIRDAKLLDQLFAQHPIDAVLHFAGLKAVEESVREPLLYYDNNVGGSLTLLSVMQKHGIRKLVFSSSATVYGDPATIPVPETAPLSPVNPYGHNKAMVEQILNDLAGSDDSWRIAILRYFNPVGAHPSGLIGENPVGTPNNLMPYIADVAMGRRQKLLVFGNDYPTKDGTGIRDYIHVCDLTKGHLRALHNLHNATGVNTYNLGTGHGYSVLDVVHAFEHACGKTISYQIAPRRPGDAACSFADPTKAKKQLGWKAQKSLKEMCEDTWRWNTTLID